MEQTDRSASKVRDSFGQVANKARMMLVVVDTFLRDVAAARERYQKTGSKRGRAVAPGVPKVRRKRKQTAAAAPSIAEIYYSICFMDAY